MQDLKVALVQSNQVWEDKSANFKNYESLLNDVSADLILLPEMFQTAFSMNTALLGEDFNNSDSIEWLKRISKIKNAAIYTSLIINNSAKSYNRGVFVTPSGKIEIYDKRKTFTLAGEGIHFQSGTKSTIVDFKGWRIQLQICYDLRFPEISRNYLLPNQEGAYDVLMYVANWPEKRIKHWNSLLMARAIENQAYVLGVNRVGTDANGLSYSGNSQAIDALGEILIMNEKEQVVLMTILKKDNLLIVRNKTPFLRDC